MKKSFLAFLIIPLSGCLGIPPEGVSQADISAYNTAVASIGCVMHGESDFLPVELQAGLTRNQSKAITAFHLNNGTAERLEEGGVKLITGGCA